MAKNERTSPKVAKVASKVMRTQTATKKEMLTLAASALTQTRDKPKPKKRS